MDSNIKNKMTIYDIAKLANVSKSTVSRVINNDDAVNKNTAERVLKIIAEHNFRPNKYARNLNAVSKKTILIIMTRLNSHAEYLAVSGIVQSSNDECEFMIFESHFCIKKTQEILEHHKNVDGIIIFAIGNAHYNFISNLIPTVFIGQKVLGKKSVYYSDYASMLELLMYAKSFRNISNVLYIGLESADPTTGGLRHQACENFCETHQLNLSSIISNFDSKQSFEILQDINFANFDLIACATDRLALGAYKHVVGQDIVITGVGNNNQINFVIDNFITIDMHYLQSGSHAFKLLFDPNISNIEMDYEIINLWH